MSAIESVYASNSSSAGDPPWWIGDFPPQWPQVTPTSVPVNPSGITFIPSITIQTGTSVPAPPPAEVTIDGDSFAGSIDLKDNVVWIGYDRVETYPKGSMQTKIGMRWSKAVFEQRLHSMSDCIVFTEASSFYGSMTINNPAGMMVDSCQFRPSSTYQDFMREVLGWVITDIPGFAPPRLSFYEPPTPAEPKEEESEKEELELLPKRLIDL